MESPFLGIKPSSRPFLSGQTDTHKHTRRMKCDPGCHHPVTGKIHDCDAGCMRKEEQTYAGLVMKQ